MRILVCPVCKSTEIDLDAGGYTGKYRCRKCGYVGSFVLEVDEEGLKELKELRDLKEVKKPKELRGSFDEEKET